MSEHSPLVLVVEDEPDLADLYAAWLENSYRVRTAYGGREALDQLDDDVDVVLLDRRMPGLSGDEVLDAIQERSIGCQVAMVTAVEPDFDVLEMGFDDYLVKPVTREELLDTVDDLERRSTYDAGVQELFSLASKKALLEAEKTDTELAENAEYQQLTERLESLRAELDTTIDEMSGRQEFETLFREFEDVDGPFDDGSDDDLFGEGSGNGDGDPFGGVRE